MCFLANVENPYVPQNLSPMAFLPLTEDFADKTRFAGEQNIAHIINMALEYPIPDKCNVQDGLYIGVDGCKGGWIAAVLDYGQLRVERFESIEEIIQSYPTFDAFLIDMPIGLRDNPGQKRPDKATRKELGAKASTVFPVPSRRAVYAETEEERKKANLESLGKSLAKQSISIIPKIKELDTFLTNHPEYKNRILESHPELAFARLNGLVVTSKKKEFFGFMERESILSEYLNREPMGWMIERAKECKCNPDDAMDAVCLSVTAALHAHGLTDTIPENPEKDRNGLEMKMTVPKRQL